MASDAKIHSLPGPAGLEEFLQLESKIERVGDVLRAAREQTQRAESARALIEQAHLRLQQAYAAAEKELVGLRREREEIRQRIGRLVKQLESAGAE